MSEKVRKEPVGEEDTQAGKNEGGEEKGGEPPRRNVAMAVVVELMAGCVAVFAMHPAISVVAGFAGHTAAFR